MQTFLLILPDFLVVVLGAALARGLGWGREFWSKAEKLVFYVLFPPLLFTSISNSKLLLGESTHFLAVGIGAMMMGVLVAWAIRLLFRKTDDVTHASIFQCGFRFNTYIGFSICQRVFDESGFALLALLIAFWVPISNAIAVTAIARAVARRDGEKTGASAGKTAGRFAALKAVAENPLIIATILGLIFNIMGWRLPMAASAFLDHLGDASLAVGLLCVGAGMRLTGIKDDLPLLATCVVERMLVLPAIALAAGFVFDLNPTAHAVLLLFAALPTSQTCYVMTTSMGGNGPMVANLTSLQTLAAMATLTLWVAVMLRLAGAA